MSNQRPSLSRPRLPFPFTLLQSHHPEWQETKRLPFDPSGMFSSSVPAAAAELPAPGGQARHELMEWSL